MNWEDTPEETAFREEVRAFITDRFPPEYRPDHAAEHSLEPEDLAAHLARQCLPEHLVERDIVDGTLFLASKASRMITGQALVIDGGVVVTG